MGREHGARREDERDDLSLGNVTCRGTRYDIEVDHRGWQLRPREGTDGGGAS